MERTSHPACWEEAAALLLWNEPAALLVRKNQQPCFCGKNQHPCLCGSGYSREGFAELPQIDRSYSCSHKSCTRGLEGEFGDRGVLTEFFPALQLLAHNAGIAQLVEHDLAKVGVASSSLVSRSSF